jgi:hypothetical protein
MKTAKEWLIDNGHSKEYLDYSLEYTASLMEQFLMGSKQQSDVPYWVIERKCESGFKYWQIFNQEWVYDIHTATKWYIKSEAEAYLIHGHFKDDYVAEHMDVSEKLPSDEDIERAAEKFFKENGYQYTSHEIFQAGAKAVRDGEINTEKI